MRKLYSALAAMLVGASALAGPRIEINKEFDDEQKDLATLVNGDIDIQESLNLVIKDATESADKEDDKYIPLLNKFVKYFGEQEVIHRTGFDLYSAELKQTKEIEKRFGEVRKNLDELMDKVGMKYYGAETNDAEGEVK